MDGNSFIIAYIYIKYVYVINNNYLDNIFVIYEQICKLI